MVMACCVRWSLLMVLDSVEARLRVSKNAYLVVIFIFVQGEMYGGQFGSHDGVCFVLARGVNIKMVKVAECITAAPSRGLPFFREPTL